MISARVAVIVAIVAFVAVGAVAAPAAGQDSADESWQPGSEPVVVEPGAAPEAGTVEPGAGGAGGGAGGFGSLGDFDLSAASLTDWINIVLVATAPLVLIILWLADVIRPGSFKRKGKRDVSGFPVIIWLFGMFVVFSAQAFGLKLGEGLPGLFGAADQAGLPVESLSENALRDQTVTLVTGVLFALVAGGVMMYLLGAKSDKDGLRIRASDLPAGVAAIALSVPLLVVASQGAVWVYERMTGAVPEQIAHETLRTIVDNQDEPAAWVMMLAVVVGIPIVEELMFRAFLQSALLRLFGSAWGAIIVTSGLFVWMHVAVSETGDMMIPWHALPTLFALSVAMGVAFERTKRIGVPMAMHIAFNAVNVALAMTVAGPAAPVG
jgi:membrane protease YdiL (CAAX protease family)